MIQSMTGFGKASKQFSDKKISIEIKSLNSKQVDLNVRIPSHYKEKELEIRKLIAKELKRGKIEIGLYAELTGGDKAQSINFEVVQKFMEELKKLAPDSSNTELLSIAMSMPETLSSKREDINKDEWLEIMEVLKEAIAKLVEFRSQEGAVLKEDFLLRIKNIQQLLLEVTPFEQERIEIIKQRIAKNLEKIKESPDENRYEQEMIYYLEKFDVTEEKIRLKNHCEYFISEVDISSNGKKLAFICQEIGREINTLGSKSNHVKLQRIVVQMKDELEKIKEQLLNVL